MKPTVGRIVHFYWSEGFIGAPRTPRSDPQAAVITALWEGTDVSLFVMSQGHCFHTDAAVPFSETPLTGHWSWPPRD